MNDYDLVIGGSGEIGLSIIKKLAGNGRNVLYTYHHNASAVTEIEAWAKGKPGQAIAVKIDIRSAQDVKDLASYITSKKMRISSLIYNAGLTNDMLFRMMSEEDFNNVMDVNLYGCFRICKALIDNLAVHRGSIVFISSVSGMTGKIGQVNYSCSKAGLIALCRNLALEYASVGLRVNCIAPGFIKTKMLDKIPEENMKTMKKNIPLKKVGSPSDVANAVYFLVSEESGYITGQTLIVDGGLLMR
ncbi:MAG: SDR family oxidoreductase [Bacteroidales bacterium]|nr:SDR family oxidoreductase [Bacteroidales bacterium]